MVSLVIMIFGTQGNLDEALTACLSWLQELLGEPVIAADGYTYEKHALQEWLKQHDSSPVTGRPLRATGILPNFAIMTLVKSRCLS